MTRDEAIKNLEEIIDEGWLISDFDKCTAIDACEMAIKALEQEPCEDCISRERTMLRVREFIENTTYTEKMLVDDLNALPPVTPQSQQKVGKWIRVDKDKLRCSECEVINFIVQYPQSAKINFCQNCGAKMEVGENAD